MYSISNILLGKIMASHTRTLTNFLALDSGLLTGLWFGARLGSAQSSNDVVRFYYFISEICKDLKNSKFKVHSFP